MKNWRQETIDTYDRSARQLSEYFSGIGPRVSYIELAGKISGRQKNPKVVEIGCGDGRDAQAITERTANYLGFDISKAFIDIARKTAPEAHFEIADAVSFNYPKNQDIVFSFASILHLDREELEKVLHKVHACLKAGGVFYISSKHAEKYRSKIKEDKFGKRMFYFYNANIVKKLAGSKFTLITDFLEKRGDTVWFEMALKKR